MNSWSLVRSPRPAAVLAPGLAVALIAPALTAAPAAAGAAPQVTVSVNQQTVRTSEVLFVRGRVTRAGEPVAGALVRVLARRGDGRFRVVGSRRTGAKGGFRLAHRPHGAVTYRATVGDARSQPVSVRHVRRDRGYGERESALGFVLGAREGRVEQRGRFGRQVTFGSYRNGVLAKVGRSTSLVRGAVLRRYRRAGGVDGRLGAPLGDANCQLLGGGCLQRFQNGTVYTNRQAPNPVSVVFGRGRKTALLAVAKSQVGYREPSYRGGKFNAWQGNRNAWCGFYLAWASRASGNGNAFPRGDTFAEQVAVVRSRGNLMRRPKRGAAAFIDYFGDGRPTHVGLVVKVRRDGRIVTFEGNVGSATGNAGHPRGVFRVVRSTGRVLFYAMPAY